MCRLCDICVIRFDHHCVWLNTCIAANNLRWFLAFVAWHVALCAYGVILCSALVYKIGVQVAAGDQAVLSWIGEKRLHNYTHLLPRIWGRAVTIVGNVSNSEVPWAAVGAANLPLVSLSCYAQLQSGCGLYILT